MKKLNIYKVFFALLVLLVLVGAAIVFWPDSAINSEAGSTLDTIKVAYKPTSHYLSVFVANEKGFFVEEKLDAELVNFDTSNQAMDAILNGQVDVARGGIVLQLKVEAEKPGIIKTFLVNKQTKENFVDYILVHRDLGITNIDQLKGKKLGTAEGLVEKTYAENIFKVLGLSGQVEIIGMKPTLLATALENKQVDALFVYEPEANVALSKGFAEILLTHPIETYVIDPFIGGGVYMKTDNIVKNPEKAKRIMNAFAKAGEFIKNNPDESRKILAKYTGLNEGLAGSLHVLPEYRTTDFEVMEAAQKHADLLYQNNVLPKKVNVGDLFYDF